MDEESIHKNKKTDKTYISRSIETLNLKPDGKDGVIKETRNIRIVSKVIDTLEEHHYAMDKKELILRKTAGGRFEIKAKLVEDNRGLFILTFQRFTSASGKPNDCSFSFVGKEISNLVRFLKSLDYVPFDKNRSSNIADNKLDQLLSSKECTKKFLIENQDVVIEFIKNELTKEDLVTLGYRKKQLEVFDKLLHEIKYFNELKIKYNAKRDEDLWQKFFERNTWIFGYGLNFVFNSTLDNKKLEQVVAGFDFNSAGKRADAFLKTKGIIESFCFAEIKTHKTELLKLVKTSYRPECWSPSNELTGAISQIQRTVHKSILDISTKTEIKDKQGNLTGETIFLYSPKSTLIIGNLGEFNGEYGINEDKYSSFEMFRQGQRNIEVITFDELYQRAQFIVENSER
ncbi:MAG: DUF4263 domain-containing protein [Labilibaculum sp.]|nr:DUF4263 domain-containing protein [Labilibaculum sp.]